MKNKIKKPVKKATTTSTKPKTITEKISSIDTAKVASSAKSYFKNAEKKVNKVNIEKFLTDAVYMLMHPVKYFTSIKADGNYENAIVKILMYGLLTAGLKILFNITDITFIGALSTILLMPIYALIITFSLAGAMLLFSYLAKGEMNFETSIKAVASCIFMYPLTFVLYKLAFTYWMLFFFSLIIDLYIIFLIYTATTTCLKGEGLNSKLIFGALALFVIVTHFSPDGGLYISNKNPEVGFKHHFIRMQKQNLSEFLTTETKEDVKKK